MLMCSDLQAGAGKGSEGLVCGQNRPVDMLLVKAMRARVRQVQARGRTAKAHGGLASLAQACDGIFRF